MDRSPEQMTWYDPVGKARCRVRVPGSDPEALELLRGAPDSGVYVATYSYWRELGAPIKAALYRASAVAQERDRRSREEERPRPYRPLPEDQVEGAQAAFLMAHPECGEAVEIRLWSWSLVCWCEACQDLRTYQLVEPGPDDLDP